MYIANAGEATKNISKELQLIIWQEERKWSHIKCSIKARKWTEGVVKVKE
jgi:hypothetical protein